MWWTLGAVIVGSALLVFSAWVFGDEWLVWRARKARRAVVVVDPIAAEIKRRSVERAREHAAWSQAWVAALRETEPEAKTVTVFDEYEIVSADGSVETVRFESVKSTRYELPVSSPYAAGGIVTKSANGEIIAYQSPVPPRGASGVSRPKTYQEGDLRMQAEQMLADKQRRYGLKLPQRFPVDDVSVRMIEKEK